MHFNIYVHIEICKIKDQENFEDKRTEIKMR